MTHVAIDLDAVLGDTRPLWNAWLEDAARRARVDLGDLPDDRVAAALELDRLVGNWRALLERFAEDHGPVYLRPDPSVNAVLRALKRSGATIEAFSDAPEELARVAVAHLGLARALDGVAVGEPDGEARIVRTRDELAQLAG